MTPLFILALVVGFQALYLPAAKPLHREMAVVGWLGILACAVFRDISGDPVWEWGALSAALLIPLWLGARKAAEPSW